MAWARRKDGPHAAIVQAFRDVGLVVLDVSRVANLGCDVVLLAMSTGRARFVELKDGTLAASKQRLTYSERKLANDAGRYFTVVRSVDEALDLAREMLRP